MKSRRSPERCASRALSAESNTSRLTESPWSTRPGYPISVWEPRRPEGIERNREILLAARVTGDRLHERRVLRFPGREEGADELRQRTELVPELLRQRLGEPRDLLAREPRHQPIAASGIDLVQREKWNGQRHAVALRARLVVVIEREAASGDLELVRKLHRGDPRRLMAHQILALEEQQLRIRAFSFAAPAVEIRAVVDTFRDQALVERADQLVVHQHVGPARLVLELLDLPHEPAVMRKERRARLVVALDQRPADEYPSRFDRVHRTVMHAPLCIQQQAVERPTLERGDARRLLLPVRLVLVALDQVRADRLEPLGL